MSDRTVIPDPLLQVQDNGKILIGGSPTTVMRLSAKGAELAEGLFAGQLVPQTKSASELCDRLVQAGMAHRVPAVSEVDFAVIVPVRNDPEGLAATKACLAHNPELKVVVVLDDLAIAMGPAEARNRGAADCDADVLIFIDAGVVVDVAVLEQLASHLAADDVVAAAPRVMSEPGSGPIASYELAHSPLDLGPAPGRVAVGQRISYVPSTLLAVRRDAFIAVGGFDPNLRYGEDVDLVWRLGEIGTVIYDPSLAATHPPRKDLRSFAIQRFNYGASAGTLARLHGSAVAPMVLSPWSVVTVGLGLAPRAKTLALWLAATVGALGRKLPGSTPYANAASISLQGHLGAATGIASASTRAWWPLSLLAMASPLRSRVLLLNAWSFMRHRSVLGLIDDLAYGAGLWRGTLRARSARSVLPRFVGFGNQSKRSSN